MEFTPAFLQNQHQAPDHYLSQRGSEFATPAHSASQIIIPVGCLDQSLMIAVRDLLEWTPGIDYNDENLYQVMCEIMNQIGDVIDPEILNFSRKLNGDPADPAVSGYPSGIHLAHTPLVLPEKWNQFLTLFRYYAAEFQSLMMRWYPLYQLNDLVYETWLPGSMVFRVTTRQTFYMGL